ncbi:MAG: formyltetrahydrofolate deformylase [Acidobacteriota bacterium]|nr:formyltetrahydrofolate deformylase [Acidobacteriota bacterium]
MKLVVYISTTDRPGLVHDITGIFNRWQLNIISNGEFVEQKAGLFFMRSEVVGEADACELERQLEALLPEESELRVIPRRKKPIVIMATRESHCVGDLLIRARANELQAEIKAVVANHENLRDLVEGFGVPFVHVPHENSTREIHEHRILKAVGQYDPEFLVLAKYMRILSPTFVAHYPYRMINIHHSFLPAFIGANPYKQAYARGVKIIGATSHFVTDDLDQGPIIAQKVHPVDHSHSARDMAVVGRDVEKITLAAALRLVFEDRVFVHGNRTVIFD